MKKIDIMFLMVLSFFLGMLCFEKATQCMMNHGYEVVVIDSEIKLIKVYK